MRILFLTQFFDPEPTFKGLVFAKSLQEKGHDITVVTGFPNYPGGAIYPGYKIKLFQKEDVDGVKVCRVPLFPSHGQSKIGRILNYISFCISSFFAVLFFSSKNDVIYVYHPPATVGASAALASFITRRPFVYDIQDLWPDTLSATGMISNPKLLKLIGQLCQWIYSRAAKIVVLSPGFKKRLLERGVKEEKIELIYNWCDEQALMQGAEKSKSDFSNSNYFNVVFAGNMGKAQGLDTVLDAAEKISNLNSKILFTFVGGGIEVENLKASVQKRNLKNVQFLNRRPMNEIGALLKSADVLLVHLKNDPLFAITVPSKTQAYLAMGRPLLMAVSGDAGDLVKQAQAGISIEPENAQAMTEALIQLSLMSREDLAAMGQRGMKFYFDQLSLKVGTLKFINLFERAVNEKT